MKVIFVWIALGLLFFGCSNSEPQIKESDNKTINFKGITARDPVGSPTNTADPDDWNFDDKWIEQEISLFGKSLSADCPLPESLRIMAFPNPATSRLSIYTTKPDSARIALRVVDKNFKLLLATDSLYADAVIYDLSKIGVQDTVRVYYKLITKSCEYRGHGDIVIKK